MQNQIKTIKQGLLSLIMAAIIITAPALARAANQDNATKPDRYVKLRVLSEKNMIQPGEEIWIAIEESIHPHWHTYWINPGDSGSPTKAKWDMPDGFEISDFQWPVPMKIPYGPLTNYGYDGNVVFLQKLKAPTTLPEGPITLTADIELLVCDEICIPEFGTHTLTLNDPANMDEDNAAFIEKAQSKMPQKFIGDALYTEHDNLFNLRLHANNKEFLKYLPEDVELLPLDWGIVKNASDAIVAINEDDQTIMLTQSRSDRSLSAIDTFHGILAFEDEDGMRVGYSFTAQPGVDDQSQLAATAPQNAPPSQEGGTPAKAQAVGTTIWVALFSALLGGLVLNLMPCVFPVLSIKALSLVKIAEKHPSVARMHGIAYTVGVVLSFLLIAGILIALQAGGSQIGWGFQLQNPVIVGALAYLLFLVGLNLMGAFEVSPRFTNFGNKLTQGQNVSNSFFTGILATLVATPCTAPFMGAAIGFALIQPAFIGLIVFAALGFGLALPYLLLSFIPAMQKILPKPGAWMDRFKEFLAFPMFASAAWLIWVVSKQTGESGVLMLLMGFTLIGFTVWLIRHLPHKGRRRHVAQTLIAIAAITVIALLPGVTSHTQHVSQTGSTAEAEKAMTFGEVFSNEKLEAYLTETDNPVFVEMTAAWCITCKYNHAVAINVRSTKKLFAEKDVKYLIGDWTNQDPEITKYLESFGRNGVPIYVYYGPKDANGNRAEPVVLPQILTPGTMKSYF